MIHNRENRIFFFATEIHLNLYPRIPADKSNMYRFWDTYPTILNFAFIFTIVKRWYPETVKPGSFLPYTKHKNKRRINFDADNDSRVQWLTYFIEAFTAVPPEKTYRNLSFKSDCYHSDKFGFL